MPGRRLGSLLLWIMGSVLVAACNVGDVHLMNTPVPAITGKAGSFDVIQIDQQAHRLYVSDRVDKGIDVFDISSARAKFLQTIDVSSKPNGLAIAPDLHRLFVGTSSGRVVVIDTDPSSLRVVKEVGTGSDADLLDYAPTTHQLFVGSASGTITAIDATTNELKKQIQVANALEQPRYNPADGMLYVTSPGDGALLQFDPDQGTLVNRIPIDRCQPGGLAINPRTNQALVTCVKSVMSVDLKTGKTQSFTQVTGGDVVSYDAKVDHFFVASPKNRPLSAIAIYGGNPVAFIAKVVTSSGGHSAAYDETNNVVYTPDLRPSSVGLTSFQVPAGDQISTSYATWLGVLAVLVVVVAVVLVFVARSGDPIRRQEREANPAPAVVAPRVRPRAHD